MGKEEQGIDQQRYCVIPRTMVLLFHANEVLLLKGAATKKRWAKKYNGLGGHIERGEDALTAARRELREESGLVDVPLHLCGTIVCDVEDQIGVLIFVYKGEVNKVPLKPGDEGTLEWIPLSEFDQLPVVEDLKVIVPRVFAWQAGDSPFSATNQYDEEEQLVTQFFE